MNTWELGILGSMEGYDNGLLCDTHENMNTVLRTVENSLFDVRLIPTHSKAIFYSNLIHVMIQL